MERAVKGGRTHYDFKHHTDLRTDSISKCVVANWYKEGAPRHWTPEAACLLQGKPADYTEGFTKTAAFKGIGNGFTVPVIADLINSIKGRK